MGKLTLYLLFDWFGWVDPVADVVVVGVLQPKVVLLDDVHLVVHLLHQLLPRRFLLQKYMCQAGEVGGGGGGRRMERRRRTGGVS